MPNTEPSPDREPRILVGYVIVRHSTHRDGHAIQYLDSPFGEREEGSSPVWLSLELALKRAEVLEQEGDLEGGGGAVVVPLYGDQRCPLLPKDATADWALEIELEGGTA